MLGWDVAGTVTAVGPDVTGLTVGQRVFGMPAFPAEAGGYAEQVLVQAEQVTPTPNSLDDQHAASLPLVALTAYQALHEVGRIRRGDRVLIQAAGGGVGHVAVQIAKAHGAHVVGTASPTKIAFVQSLGADHVIDYTASKPDRPDPVDLAIDPFGGPNTLWTLQTVRDGGLLTLLVGVFDDQVRTAAAARDVRLVRISVVPNAASLHRIAELSADGRLVPHISATFPLDQAAEAHRHLDVGVQGKIVLLP